MDGEKQNQHLKVEGVEEEGVFNWIGRCCGTEDYLICNGPDSIPAEQICANSAL